jgi:hypothetical protein
MLKISSFFGLKTDGVSFLLKIGSGAAAHWILDHGSGIWV